MSGTGYRFNHDLLINDESLSYVRYTYPKIFDALDHPELREFFKPIDDEANRRKASSRSFGILSIILLSLALMAASSAHYIPVPTLSKVVGGIAALAGLIGVAIGAFGVLLRDRKERWLLHRFETERLRQFFFQTLIMLAPDILWSARTNDWAAFRARRDEAFRTLVEQLKDRLEPTVNAAVAASGAQLPNDVWLLRASSTTATDTPCGDDVEASWIAAYRFLRLEGQRAYAEDKLDARTPSFRTKPVFQQKVIRGVGGSTIAGSVVLHLALAVAILVGASDGVIGWLHCGAIWLAIIALAMRTLDEGLRPGQEIERYSAYRDATTRLLGRYDAATTFEERRAIMREMEETSYNELVQFIVSNRSATYAM